MQCRNDPFLSDLKQTATKANWDHPHLHELVADQAGECLSKHLDIHFFPFTSSPTLAFYPALVLGLKHQTVTGKHPRLQTLHLPKP